METPLWKAPGVEMAYCSFGYHLLGEIVRRVSGTSLADFARERLFAPLGMHDTDYVVPAAAGRRVVKRPAGAPGADSDRRESQELPNAAGGVYARLWRMQQLEDEIARA